MKTIVKKYDVSRCVLIVPASPHPFRSSQNRPSLLFSDFYILVRTIWCHSKLFYTTTIFSIISYFLTLLAALPFLPIVAKISGWTRPDRQPRLSFSYYEPEHIYIWLYSDYSSNSCTILALSPYYSPDQKGKRLPFLLLCIHLFSSKMGTGRTHTHRQQSMLHNKKSQIFRRQMVRHWLKSK